jgi:hypothetical protein
MQRRRSKRRLTEAELNYVRALKKANAGPHVNKKDKRINNPKKQFRDEDYD